MYNVGKGAGRFGTTVAVHSSRNIVSVFAGVHDNYAILRSGCVANRTQLVLEGYWRYAAAEDTGLIRLTVGPPALAATLCAETGPGTTPLPAAVLDGATGVSSVEPKEPTFFSFVKALIDPQGRFSIVGHHGACGTNDDCSVSENSLPSIRLVETVGANAVEVDVRLTKDGIPILFHDDNFGPRLNNGVYCHGSVNQFTLAHMRALCKLRYEEDIPTLEQALQVVVDETSLGGVWLDVKVPEAIGPTLELMAKYREYALAKKRNVGLVLGLGERDVLDAFRATAAPPGTQCLVELEVNDVRGANCEFWGPRWTRGPMRSEVQALQGEGRAVVYWTIDEAEYLDLFLVDGQPNGIVTARPALLFHRYQTLGTVPRERTPL
jgi:glycerophosphoryl diester phosphodiesterase